MQKLNPAVRKTVFFALAVIIALFLSFQSDWISPGDPLDGSDTLRCAFALNTSIYSKAGLPEEFNYEMLKKFSSKIDKILYVENVKADEVFDLLGSSEFDMAVYDVTNTLPEGFDDEFAYSTMTRGDMVWLVPRSRHGLLVSANKWLRMFCHSKEYDTLVSDYFRSYVVEKYIELDENMCQLTPYDKLIQKYSDECGIDWKLVASVMFQESRLHFMAVSHKNAKGLMQVRPQTAERFGVSDLTDPEENIKAGTRYLKYLYDKYDCPEIEDKYEVMKLALAAYNAGEGRIASARHIADSLGYDRNDWPSVRKVFKEIPDFSGRETSEYVERVLNRYEQYIQVTKNEHK